MSDVYGQVQNANYAQSLGAFSDRLIPPDPFALAQYRAVQEAEQKKHEERYAQQQAAELARMQADRNTQRRAAALEAALRISIAGSAAKQVLSDAAEFDAFLNFCAEGVTQ